MPPSKSLAISKRGYIHHNGKLVWDPADWEQTLIFKGLLKTIGIIVAVVLPFYILFVLRQREKQFYFLQTIS